MAFAIDNTVIDVLDSANADLYVNESKLVLGDSIDPGDTVVAKTRSDYAFTIDSQNRANIYFAFSDGMGGNEQLWFVLNEARTIGTVVYQQVMFGTDYGSIVAITEQVPVDVVGANNVYLIDGEDLATINNDRFVPDGLGGVRDYGNFILSVLELPFEMPEDYILESELIQLATLQTSVSAPKLNNDVITIDMGEITVSPEENNLLDYANTVVTLHLPRIDSVVLDSNYVIGETISIEYLIDCYTGGATINISSTKLNDVFLTLNVDLGVSVPYASESRNPTANNINVVVGGDNGIETPFIEVARNDAVIPYGFFTSPVVDEDIIGNQNGFVQIEQVELQTKANSGDAQQIRTILASGVIIK